MNAEALKPWPEADPSILAPVPERDDLREVVRQLIERKADHKSVRAATETTIGYSVELWTQLNGDLEVSSMLIPEALGGSGFGLREIAIVLEETGAALLPEPLLSSAVLGASALSAADDSEVVRSVLGELASGKKLVTVALEDNIVMAEEDATGWTMSGHLPRVLHGGAADSVVVNAGSSGFFLIDANAVGVTVVAPEILDSTRRQVRVVLDKVQALRIVGPERTESVHQTLQTLQTIAVASEHVGIIDRALKLTTVYVQERHQFGRAIGSFQAIKHRLADVLVDLQRARSAANYAAAVFDEDPSAAELPGRIAGAVCTDAVIRATHEMVQLHGGIGFTWEHPAHVYVRRALGDEALFADGRTHRSHVARLIGV